ncbi:MAG: Wzz/FepE/Etk N-terminal domain-containing protein [Clostridia bacterium]|nr:Wzz/FepE/Etk N-terminal domain-containing protein [Clostridia bacterium]
MAQEKTGTGSVQGDILSFDLMIIVHDVIRKWRWILAAAILAGLLSYVWKDVSYRPEYTTNTTFVVTYQGSSSTVYQNLSTASGLTAVFSEVLNSSTRSLAAPSLRSCRNRRFPPNRPTAARRCLR